MTMRYRFDVYSSQLSPTFHPCGNSRSTAVVIRCVFYLRREGSLKSYAGLNKTDDTFSNCSDGHLTDAWPNKFGLALSSFL